MISIDTNILLRLVLHDDPDQEIIAAEIVHDAILGEGLFISSFVVLELSWNLKVRKLSRTKIYTVISELFSLENTCIADANHIKQALEWYEKGKADFSDYMILSQGHMFSARTIKTFDKKFHRDAQEYVLHATL